MLAARRSAAIVALATTLMLVAAAPALAACEDHFPTVEWLVATQTDLITVKTVDVPEGQALRFADTAAETARTLESDLGTVPPLELCLYAPSANLPTEGLLPVGQQLHSVVFDDGTVVIGTLQSRIYDETQAFGLSYAALHGLAERIGEPAYPEPLASAVGQWYAARAAGKLEVHHSQMRTAAFFRDPDGDGVDPSDWAASTQPPAYTWNPQFHESPISDLVEYAVSTHGISVLEDATTERWETIEIAWQASLRNEAVQGRSSGNAWLVGLGIVIGAVAAAALLALHQRRLKLRAKRPFAERSA